MDENPSTSGFNTELYEKRTLESCNYTLLIKAVALVMGVKRQHSTLNTAPKP